MELKLIFTGLCIFMHLGDAQKARVILPDFRVAESIVEDGVGSHIIDKHIGYIEFRLSDIDTDPKYRQPDLIYKVDDREGNAVSVEYGLIRLDGEAITVSGIKDGASDSYAADVTQLEADHLLSLSKIVANVPEPGGNLVGSFDIRSGSVGVYAIDGRYKWFFKPKAKDYLDTPRFVAQEVAVTMQRTKDPLEIKVGNKAIRFKSTAATTRVRVGNATLEDILMLNGSHHDTDYHFANYYKPSGLFFNNVTRLPLPRKQKIGPVPPGSIGFGVSVRSGNCPPVNYP